MASWGIAMPARAARLMMDRPGDREFIRDTADLLSPGQVRELRQRCNQLLDDTGVPLLVVTVESMAALGGADMTIESFSRTLMEQWGDSHPLNHGQDWAAGILVVIAVDDRRARIELGRNWPGQPDGQTRRVMDQQLIPALRAGDYAAGIAGAVGALDQLARGEPLPADPVPARTYLWWSVFVALAIFTAVSLGRRGSAGWAFAFWSGALMLLATLLYKLTQKISDQPGTAGGGASLGGGGGSTGSW